ncbi:hypothetical protein LTR37_006958 [Vermiconidia calcicola]|uniref:Uncharacterized protein n=1 Tax=Vermiconidia calcicola TaxID=1690605 RepID=A0ACC3NEW8_9PEZI|nr:hypothetical protein LTR37_006958 [Vermiconidia calcicola]
MRFALTFALPSILLLQSIAASPAWMRSEHDVCEALYDADPGKLGAVASESSICSNIGIDILRCGGNAADSLVATVLCIGVVGMYHSGIGGGGFMLVRSSNGTFENIDFRETAPAAAFERMYNKNTNSSIYGGLASGVPGELRGLAHLHENYGVLPWSEVVMPAVKVARHGWLVNEDLVSYMELATAGIDNFLVNEPTWAIDFAPEGKLLKLNDTITRRRYADTLETIAQRGPDAFYTGPIAEATIKTLQATNGTYGAVGTMTLKDLKNYTIAIREPAAIDYRDYKVRSCSAPSSGIVAMSALKISEGFDSMGWPSALNISTHRFDEAIRFAYGQRSELGDPEFVEGMDEYQADMLNASTARIIRNKINDFTTLNVSAYDPSGFESLETPGTSAVVVSDASGMAISLTTTVNLLFGSHVMIPETGVIMNNEMNDFSIPGISNAFGYVPSPANYIRPGKRPLSSITPTIAEAADGMLYFVVAAAGGSRIITSTLQNLWHVLDQNMTAPEALARPRFHDQLVPNEISFEYGYNNETVAFMESRGHNCTYMAPGSSTAQSLRMQPNGTFEAAGEPRQDNSGGFAI